MACGCGCGGGGTGKGQEGQPQPLLTGVVNLPIEINASNQQVGQQWVLVRPQRFVPPAARASDK